MPYVTKKIREELVHRSPINPVELNYIITKIVDSYLSTNEESIKLIMVY